MNPAPYGPPPQYQAAPAQPDGRALLETPAIRTYLKAKVYERAATVAEIEVDLAVIRAITARGKSRSPLYLLALLGSLGMGFLLAVTLRRPPESPMSLALGVVGAIVIGVFWSMEPSHESKRVELASGLLRRLNLEPGSQVQIKLDLAPLTLGRKKRIDRDEGGWNVTFHHDDWLLLEGRIVGDVAFRYTRGESQKQAVQVEIRGNTRITRTRTEGWFHDAVALRFASDGFPGAATLGPDAYKKMKMPEGFETKHFLGQPGMLELTVTSDRKWDAAPPGMRLDGGDGVKIAGLWFSILFDLLGALRQPFQLDGEPPPSPAVKLDIINGKAIGATVTHPAFAGLALLLPGLLLVYSGVYKLGRASDYGDDAVRQEREVKTTRDAKAREAVKRLAKSFRDMESDATTEGAVKLGIGILLTVGGGGLGTFMFMRRRKKAAQPAQPSPALLPPGAAPPQGGYPQQPPLGAYPVQPPQGAYPQQQPQSAAPPQTPPEQGIKGSKEW